MGELTGYAQCSAVLQDLTRLCQAEVRQLTARQQIELVGMRAGGEYSIADLVGRFSVGRATVYRVLERAGRGCVGEAA